MVYRAIVAVLKGSISFHRELQFHDNIMYRHLRSYHVIDSISAVIFKINLPPSHSTNEKEHIR